MLLDPDLEVAVLSANPTEISIQGLGFDHCDLCIVTGEDEGPPTRLLGKVADRIRSAESVDEVWGEISAMLDLDPDDSEPRLCSDPDSPTALSVRSVRAF